MRGRVLPIKIYASDWFAHLILRLCYLDLGVLCEPHPSCLQYLMQGRVLSIKACTSDSSYACDWFAHLILRLCYLDLGVLCKPHPSCLQSLMRGRVLPIKACTSDSSVTWTMECAAILILFAFSISCGEYLSQTMLFPHLSYKVLGFLARLFKGLDAISY